MMVKKKKANQKKKVKKIKKKKKIKSKKKVIRKKIKRKVKRKPTKRKSRVRAEAKEKVIGKIEHYFGKISVAALKLKYPIKVGDMLSFKGQTTDFSQRINSMQINHQDVLYAKKGEDVGIKVKEKVRVGDTVFLIPASQLIQPKPEQKPRDTLSLFRKPEVKPESRPQPQFSTPAPKPMKSDPYSKVKFLKF